MNSYLIIPFGPEITQIATLTIRNYVQYFIITNNYYILQKIKIWYKIFKRFKITEEIIKMLFRTLPYSIIGVNFFKFMLYVYIYDSDNECESVQ